MMMMTLLRRLFTANTANRGILLSNLRSLNHRGSTNSKSLGFSSVNDNRNFSTDPKRKSLQIPASSDRFRENVGKIDAAVSIFHNLMHRKPVPRLIEFNIVLGDIMKLEGYETVMSLIKEMESSGITPDVYTRNIQINCCLMLGKPESGLAVLGKLITTGNSPIISTYNTILKGLFEINDVSKADELFHILLSKNICSPNVVTFGTVIKGIFGEENIHKNRLGFLDTGKSELAIRVFRYMEEKTTVKPNTKIYTMMIDGLCKEGKVETAFEFLKEMEEKRVYPNVITFNVLIRGLCWIEKTENAEKLVKEMDKRNIHPNVSTFNTLVESYSMIGNFEAAKRLIFEMKGRGLKPDVVTYTSVIEGHAWRGEMDKAREVMKTMDDNNVKPNIITYNSLITGHCRKKEISEALALFNELPVRKLDPTTPTVTTLMQGLFLVGRDKEAMELFKQMKSHHLTVNIVTLVVVIDGLCHNDRFQEAFSIFRASMKQGAPPNIYLYTILIDASIKKGYINLAKRLGAELCSRGLQFNVVTVTAWIRWHCYEGNVEKAKQLFETMENYGVSPNSVTFNIVLRGLMRFRVKDVLLFLKENLHEGRGFDLDLKSCHYLDQMKLNESSPIRDYVLSYERFLRDSKH